MSPFDYGDASLPRYPNPGRKRKSGPAKGTNPAGKKKTEKENNEVTCLVEIPNEETLEVIQKGMSYPQPSERETEKAMQELTNEVSEMVDQATQTPPQPSLEEVFHFFQRADKSLGQKYLEWLQKNMYDIPGPPPPSPRVRRKEDVERDRPLTDYEKQLLREIQELKSREEDLVPPAPPPPKYSDSVQNWQKFLKTVAYDSRTGLPSDGLF